MKTKILNTIEDLVSQFLYYGRKEDEDLPVGAIDEAVRAGTITVDEIAGAFRTALERGLS